MMLVWRPLREMRKILPDFFIVGMKKVRPIVMDEDAAFVAMVMAVAANGTAAFNKENGLSRACQTLGEHGTGKAGTDDDDIEHDVSPFPHFFRRRRNTSSSGKQASGKNGRKSSKQVMLMRTWRPFQSAQASEMP